MYLILSILKPLKTIRFQRVQLNSNYYFKIVFYVAGSRTTWKTPLLVLYTLENRKSIPTVFNDKDNYETFQMF